MSSSVSAGLRRRREEGAAEQHSRCARSPSCSADQRGLAMPCRHRLVKQRHVSVNVSGCGAAGGSAGVHRVWTPSGGGHPSSKLASTTLIPVSSLIPDGSENLPLVARLRISACRDPRVTLIYCMTRVACQSCSVAVSLSRISVRCLCAVTLRSSLWMLCSRLLRAVVVQPAACWLRCAVPLSVACRCPFRLARVGRYLIVIVPTNPTGPGSAHEALRPVWEGGKSRPPGSSGGG